MFSFQEGERGYLEGLASRYADLFSTHYVDVLAHLEDLRRIEWSETSVEVKERNVATPDAFSMSSAISGNGGMTTSQSQPLYVPGKYSVSYKSFAPAPIPMLPFFAIYNLFQIENLQ